MKNIFFAISFGVFFLSICGCGNIATRSSQNTKDSSDLTTKDLGNPIIYSQTPVIDVVYVTDRNGAQIRQQADEASGLLGLYDYGTRLEVIEDNENWLGVRDRITRTIEKDDGTIETNRWEKIYVSKIETGSIDQISLIQSDLNVISSLTIDDNRNDSIKELKDYLGFEIIDKKLFDSKKNSAVNFLLADTTVIRKENGTINLNNVAQYQDVVCDGDAASEFNYSGQFEFLNAYLIHCVYYENWGYQMIDKTSGELVAEFGDYPYISPDKRYVISVRLDPYESMTDLELYAIKGPIIKPIFYASFTNWMPVYDDNAVFWGSDGYLYLSVQHSKVVCAINDDRDIGYQYIRIKVLS